MEEALGKLQTGQLGFDVFVPTRRPARPAGRDQAHPAAQPQLHPEHQQCLEGVREPLLRPEVAVHRPVHDLHDRNLLAQRPRARARRSQLANPWAFLWQPQYKGKVAILDDYREGMSLGLMKNGGTDLNTTDVAGPQRGRAVAARPRQAGQRPHRQQRLHQHPERPDVDPPVLVRRHRGSGAVHAEGRAGRGGQLLVPRRRQGPGRNDTLAVLKGGKNPVLAHLFLNYFLNTDNALENISYNGYMQPLSGVTPERLIKEKILPPSLTSTVVLESYFTTGLHELELPAARTRALAAGLARTSARASSGGSTQRLAPPRPRRRARTPRRGPRRLLWAGCPLPAMVWLLLLFVVPFYVALRGRRRPDQPDHRYADPGLEPAGLERRGVPRGVFQSSPARVRSSARSCCAPSVYVAHRRAPLAADRLPRGVLRQPVRRPPEGAAARRCCSRRSGSAT